VPDVLEDVAMELIRAGLGYNIDHSAVGAPILSAVVVGLHAKLLQSVGIRKGIVHVRVVIQVAAAIQLIIHSIAARTVDRDRLNAGIGTALRRVAFATSVGRLQVDCAGSEEHQRSGIPSLERQVGDSALVDCLTQGTAARVYKLGIGLNGDR